MSPAPTPAAAPDVHEVARTASLEDPVIRNLRITECYHLLSNALVGRTGLCANWCTFATWASRQAGRTIRGEDFQESLARRLNLGAEVLHPVTSLWRALLRKGLFNPETRLDRAVRQIHSPFDAFERASDAVARGNRKVFEEIGRQFARYMHTCPEDVLPDSKAFQTFLAGLREGDPPEGQELLRRSFRHYQQQGFETGDQLRAELIFLANIEIGLHEQTRLQPEIREAMDAPGLTAHVTGAHILAAVFPHSKRWWPLIRRPAAAVLQGLGVSFSRFALKLTRLAITDSLMVLSLPGNVLALGRHLEAAFPALLRKPEQEELRSLLARFEPAPPASDDCGAKDWSNLSQRVHYILHLFRSNHDRADLFTPPFTSEQALLFRSGVVPDGSL
ncbi:MAG: hypothetical protein WD696_20055 [Bryobacteraceae bacterium]